MIEPEILLGMSVLKQLDFYQRGNQLKLQQLPPES
jgi:predicted aspartyl protease